jgi:hypothetical protein
MVLVPHCNWLYPVGVATHTRGAPHGLHALAARPGEVGFLGARIARRDADRGAVLARRAIVVLCQPVADTIAVAIAGVVHGADLRFGRIVVSGTEAPNMLVNLV